MTHDVAQLKDRTKRFAPDVLAFVDRFPSSDTHRNIGRQLIRSATAVGANYRSAYRSRSRAEFVARIEVVLEEADESAFWLEILIEGGRSLDEIRSRQLLEEANQLTALFAASSITASHNRDR